MKGKKRVKRRLKRKSGSGGKLYFNADTQRAIVGFQQETEFEKKEKIYIAAIFPAFDKLVENLIFIYGFLKAGVVYDELKNDCLSFLYESIHKWKPEKGSKAFSYFNVVAKNWLVIEARQRKKRQNRNVSINDYQTMPLRDRVKVAESYIVEGPEHEMIESNFKKDILKLINEIRRKTTNTSEMACLDAVYVIFSQVEDLDYLNKRAVFVYIRNISGLNSKQLSVAMSAVRKQYRLLVKSGGEYDIF